jgi:DNA-binding NarL/FixJ family response regulator
MPDRAIEPGQSVNTGCPFFVPKRLTDREREALSLAAMGWTTRAIARRLSVAERTAKAHLQAAREKLDAQNTTHAVAIALSRRLIDLNAYTVN